MENSNDSLFSLADTTEATMFERIDLFIAAQYDYIFALK